jgi:hypothetical protein
MAENPCKVAVKTAAAAGQITDAEAEDILKRAKRIAKERARIKQINIEEAVKEIQGEMSILADQESKIVERQLLLNFDARKKKVDKIVRLCEKNKIPFLDGLYYLLLGSEKKEASGFGGGLFNLVHTTENRAKALLTSRLKASGVIDHASKNYNPLNVAAEISARNGGPNAPGHTNDPIANKLADVYVKNLDEANANLRLAGGILEEKAGWAIPVTHNYDRIYDAAKKANRDPFQMWKEEILRLLDIEKTTQINGPNLDELLQDVFNNFKTGKHDWGFADELFPDKPQFMGGLAKRFAKEKVLHFKGVAEEIEYAKKYGNFGDNISAIYQSLVSRRAKTAVIMRELGPSGPANLDAIVKDLYRYANEGQSDETMLKNIESLNVGEKERAAGLPDWRRWYNVATGNLDVPISNVIAKSSFAAKTIVDLGPGAGMLLSSFGDAAVQVPQMMYAGASMLTSVGNRIATLFKSGEVNADILRGLGQGTDAFVADTAGLVGNMFLSTEWLRSVRKTGFSLSLMNWWTQSGRTAMAMTISTEWGSQAAKTFDQLSDTHRRMLEKYDMPPAVWDAIRSSAGKFNDGPMKDYDVISVEMFDKISDDVLNSLIAAEGKQPTTANRRRMRLSLQDKWADFLSDRIAAGMSDPGGYEKNLFTGGGRLQAGTVAGEAMRAIFMYKSFPISTFRRQKGMYQNLGMARGTAAAIAQVAALTIAGYMSMTIKNLLAGKEPPSLVDENDEFNHKVFFQALERGGAGGMYATVLFGEYKSHGRSLADALIGPMFSKGIEGLETIKQVIPDDKEEEDDMWKARTYRKVENMVPILNLFYIKPAYEHALGFYIKEMLSPGFLEKQEQGAEQRGEEYYIRPSDVESMPLGQRMELLGTKVGKTVQAPLVVPKKIVEPITD